MTEKQYSKYKEYLSSLGSKPGLECMEALLKKLGDPQDELLFIHVAGTNGKGSVCAFLTSILERAGLKTGRYTSPAVFDERERFTAGGRMIGKSTMLRLMDRIKEASSQLVSEGMRHPTLFETETALAFLFFASKKCDIVVLECGMGGLLDATNVIKNALLEVITSVSIDHEAFLGKGLSAIASQKAGIIKQGSTVVSAPQHPEVRKVLEAACAEKSARLVTLSDEDISDVRTGRGRQSFVFSDKLRLTTTLIGSYQIYNAALAAATAFELPRALDGYTGSERLKTERVAALIKKGVDKNAVKEGILAAEWPGRFQIIMNKPCFVIDGAHNRDGATQFARSLDM
ncbi:MAG: bifunctional folylpolyglutamate synthase/dihydrofolate synthase, partial [Lachnospiraceae bacterium]|nr:bifunctional folylpolyglutamate synthase/dihydrofolate synthase [Lachnospiraceae bacterium]